MVGDDDVRCMSHGPMQLVDRFVVSPRVVQHSPEIRVDDGGERIELTRPLHRRKCGSVMAGKRQHHGVRVLRPCATRIERQRVAMRPNCLRGLPVIQEADLRQSGVRVGERRIASG